MLGMPDASWFSGHCVEWLRILLDASVKGFAVLAGAGALSVALRRSSAAARHLLWLLAIAALICLPVLSAVLPGWQVPLLPRWDIAADVPAGAPLPVDLGEPGSAAEVVQSPSIAVPPPASPGPWLGQEPAPSLDPPPAMTARGAVPPAPTRPPDGSAAEAEAFVPVHWSVWVMLAWAGGAAVVLMPLLVGTVRIWRMTRQAQSLSAGPWSALLRALASELRLDRSVKLLKGGGTVVPATWGVWRPVVILPAAADAWPGERRRVVLVHELAHVKRWDCLTQLIAQIACAAYWFNPLAWLATRMLRAERERACDDLVLTAGSQPSDYAGHLLAIVRSVRRLRVPSLAAVSMARHRGFEKRLRAILEVGHSRRTLTRLAVVVALAAVSCLVLPLAAMRPAAEAEAPPAKAEAEPAASPTTRPAEAGARQVAEAFLSAATAGNDIQAIRLTDPASAVPHQVRQFREIPGAENLKIARVRADAAAALAVTTRLKDKRGREAVLLLKLIRSRGLWVVTDIDLAAPDKANAEYGRFLKKHPNAVAIPGASPTARPDGWGPESHGVSARLRATRDLWRSGEIPVFLADIRNRGKLELTVGRGQEPCELELDGRRYGWRGGKAAKASAFGPGREYSDVPISLAGPWRGREDGSVLNLTPGEHSLRVLFRCSAPDSVREGPVAASNLVRFKFLHGEAYVMGEVERPGLYSLTGRPVNLKQLLRGAGYPEARAKDLVVTLIRRQPDGSEKRTAWDLERLLSAEEPGVFLTVDDLVVVHPRGLLPAPAAGAAPATQPAERGRGDVFVGGEVQRPGAYPVVGRRLTLLRALALAGYQPHRRKGMEAALVRRTPAGAETHLRLDIDAILAGRQADVVLRAGDVVQVRRAGTAPTTQPAEPRGSPGGAPAGQPGQAMDTRVYDIRSLTSPAEDFAAPAVWSHASQKAWWEKRRQGARKRTTDAIIELIRAQVDPASWTSEGRQAGVRALDGNLLVTQTPGNHQKIKRLLEGLTEKRSWHVSVEGRFIGGSAKDEAELREWIRKQFKAAPGDQAGGILLTEEQAQALLRYYVVEKAASSEARVRQRVVLRRAPAEGPVILSAPRLMVFNGQRAHVMFGTQTAHLLRKTGADRGEVVMAFLEGVILDVEPTMSADRTHVTMTVRPTVTEFISERDKPVLEPVFARASLSVTASIPNNHSLLLRVPFAMRKTVGVKEVTDPSTGARSYQAVTSPAGPAGGVQQSVYVLVKAQILHQKQAVASNVVRTRKDETGAAHVQTAAQAFLRAVADGKDEAARGLVKPGTVKVEGLARLREQFDLSQARVLEVFAAENDSCAVTSFFPPKKGDRRMAMGIGLRKDDDRWLVRDIDALPEDKAARRYVENFLKHFPAARRLVLQAGPAVAHPKANVLDAEVGPVFRVRLQDAAVLDLDSGQTASRKPLWPEGFELAWDGLDAELSVRPKSPVRMLLLSDARDFGDAATKAKQRLKRLMESRTPFMRGQQARFFAVLTSDGRLAVVEAVKLTGGFADLAWAKEPMAGVPAAAAGAGAEAGFRPAIERTINDIDETKTDQLIDFETGKLFSLPEGFGDWAESKCIAWMAERGIDALVDHASSRWAVGGYDFAAASMGRRKWETIRPADVREKLAEGKPGVETITRGRATSYLMGRPGEADSILAFKTAQGGMGVLEVLGFADRPRGMRVRYKMLKDGQAEVPSPVPQPTTAPGPRSMKFRVIHAETNNPLAEVWLKVTAGSRKHGARTDENGIANIRLPAGDIRSLNVRAVKDGFVPMRVRWSDEDGGEPIPDAYTLKLPPGTSIGGIVRDARGKPIQSAEVFLLVPTEAAGVGKPPREVVSIWDHVIKTDAKGRWRCDIVPGGLKQISIRLQHRDYVSDAYYGQTVRPPMEQLRKMTAVMTMKSGLAVTGRVLDGAGKPIRAARVAQGNDRWGTHFPETRTNDKGEFRFGSAKDGEMILTVQARGFAPELKRVTVRDGMSPVEFRLAPPRAVSGRVVGADGKPVRGVRVVADTWRGCRTLQWSQTTGADGRFRWTEAPAEEVLFDVVKRGQMSVRRFGMSPSEKEHVVTMLPLLRVRGKVTDAATGKPVQKFTVMRGMDSLKGGPPWWSRRQVDMKTFTGGAYELVFGEPSPAHLVRVEAHGYKPAVSRLIKSDEGEVTIDLRLESGVGPSGVVVGTDGKPLAGAEVLLCTPSEGAYIRNGTDTRSGSAPSVRTGANGRFSFVPQSDPFLIVVVHDSGYAEVTQEELAAGKPVRVWPWCRVEGTLRIGAKPGVNERVSASFDRQYDPKEPRVYHHCEVKADKNGRFVFDRLPPGKARAGHYVQVGPNTWTYSHAVAVALKPGDKVQISIGGTGRPVVGRIAVPDDAKGKVDFNYRRGSVSSKMPELAKPPFPEGIEEMTLEQRRAWYEKWRTSEEGKAYEEARRKARDARRQYALRLGPDGSFRIEDVVAGTHELRVSFHEPPPEGSCGSGELVGTVHHEFTVPQMPGGRSDTPLDVGALEVSVRKRCEVGDVAPPFEVKTLDGKPVKLADFRGRYVLLDFWATWCGPCLGETPHLKVVHAAFGGHERFAMVGLSLDKDVTAPKKYVAARGLKWIHGFLGDWSKTKLPSEYGVMGIPATFLIGPEGRIVAKGLRGEAIKAAVAKALGS